MDGFPPASRMRLLWDFVSCRWSELPFCHTRRLEASSYLSRRVGREVKAYDISFILLTLHRALAHLALIAFFAVSRRFSGLGVTRTGNTHLRRVVTEAAWA